MRDEGKRVPNELRIFLFGDHISLSNQASFFFFFFFDYRIFRPLVFALRLEKKKKKKRDMLDLNNEFCFLGLPIMNIGIENHTDGDEKKKRNNLLFLFPPLHSL
jgi:hypothetical protein